VPEWIEVDDVRGDVTEEPAQEEGAVSVGGQKGADDDGGEDLRGGKGGRGGGSE